MGTLVRRLRQISVGPRSGRTESSVARVLRNGVELLKDPDWRVRLAHPTQDSRPDLRDADFRGCSLTDFDLRNCRLNRSVFDGAQLDGTLFSNSDLSGSSFVGSSLVDSKLDAVRALDVRFDLSVLRFARLVAANLAFSSFRHASLDGADLTAATFLKADLRNCSFQSTVRAGTDFEEADTTCVFGGGAQDSAWIAYAIDSNAPSFAGALRHYLSLKNLSGHGTELGLRAIEAAIERSQDPQQELRGLLTSRLGWRVQLIGACASICGGAVAETAGVLWDVIERRSWVGPQLVAAAARCDPRFVERGHLAMGNPQIPMKARGAIAAMLLTFFRAEIGADVARSATELGSTEREGFSIAPKWAARMDELTEPTTTLTAP